MTSERHLARAPSTPWYEMALLLGFGNSAASLATSKTKAPVPSELHRGFHQRLLAQLQPRRDLYVRVTDGWANFVKNG
jgi:hypothetical protein